VFGESFPTALSSHALHHEGVGAFSPITKGDFYIIADIAAFKHRIRQLTGRSWGVSMAYRLERLARYIRGWMNYFGISDYYRPIPELDHWLRRRLRMCYWKQWRRVRTKVRHLLARGTGKRQAILTALSSKGYWHLSKPWPPNLG
jgi:Group II intron, maturase-specific domain